MQFSRGVGNHGYESYEPCDVDGGLTYYIKEDKNVTMSHNPGMWEASRSIESCSENCIISKLKSSDDPGILLVREPKEYLLDDNALLREEMHRCGKFGLGLALDMIPISTCDSDQAPDLYVTSHEDVMSEGEDVLPVWTCNELCRQRMTDLRSAVKYFTRVGEVGTIRSPHSPTLLSITLVETFVTAGFLLFEVLCYLKKILFRRGNLGHLSDFCGSELEWVITPTPVYLPGDCCLRPKLVPQETTWFLEDNMFSLEAMEDQRSKARQHQTQYQEKYLARRTQQNQDPLQIGASVLVWFYSLSKAAAEFPIPPQQIQELQNNMQPSKAFGASPSHFRQRNNYRRHSLTVLSPFLALTTFRFSFPLTDPPYHSVSYQTSPKSYPRITHIRCQKNPALQKKLISLGLDNSPLSPPLTPVHHHYLIRRTNPSPHTTHSYGNCHC
uniref:Uncharacterized protein n=1 Tax=Timema douglasi TaxID=61478 RepID=A0A7R8ZC03_TIMDO|nr:unnamed protein product [Timema douglasi]